MVCMRHRTSLNVVQHKSVNFLKTSRDYFVIYIYVFSSSATVSVFYVWPREPKGETRRKDPGLCVFVPQVSSIREEADSWVGPVAFVCASRGAGCRGTGFSTPAAIVEPVPWRIGSCLPFYEWAKWSLVEVNRFCQSYPLCTWRGVGIRNLIWEGPWSTQLIVVWLLGNRAIFHFSFFWVAINSEIFSVPSSRRIKTNRPHSTAFIRAPNSRASDYPPVFQHRGRRGLWHGHLPMQQTSEALKVKRQKSVHTNFVNQMSIYVHN